MVDRVSFSDQEQSLELIASHHSNVESALYEYFSGTSESLEDRFPLEIRSEVREASLSELDFSSSMSVMAALEAVIRIDYLTRAYEKRKDKLSRAMRGLYQEKENKAKIDDDILQLWAKETTVPEYVVQQVKAAFKYRHWLAHGRYWTPKLGRRYDYLTVYTVADTFIDAMDQYSASV